jgi:hypothetical protein
MAAQSPLPFYSYKVMVETVFLSHLHAALRRLG